jgi:soluble lytic murein transglycosylase-like protein
MRFVIAALAAFFVLMFDFDGSRAPSSTHPTGTNYALLQRTTAKADRLPVRFLAPVEAAEAPAVLDEPEVEAPAPVNDEIEAPAVAEREDFCRALQEAAEASGLPVAFFARLIWQESRFNLSEVSRAGALGVAQFMPETATEVGLDDPFDPFKALPASARLLRQLREEFGNLGLAAAAYNAGRGRIQKWLSREAGLPQETRDYVRIITGSKAENWTDKAQVVPMRIDLPSRAPCEGFGGLSKEREVMLVPVSLAPSADGLIRKAEAEEIAAAKLLAESRAARKRVALALRAGRAAGGPGRRFAVAANSDDKRAHAARAERHHALHMASAGRRASRRAS